VVIVTVPKLSLPASQSPTDRVMSESNPGPVIHQMGMKRDQMREEQE
jgi:hypothetical protein